MFETLDIAEVGLPDIFSGQGLRVWWYVQQRLHTHWFHVTYLEKYNEDGEELVFSHLIFFTHQDHLIQFAELPEKKIEHVYIVTPKHMNGSSHWKMESLKEIWEADEPENRGQHAHIFKLGDGKEYVDSGLGTPASILTNKICLFSMP